MPNYCPVKTGSHPFSAKAIRWKSNVLAGGNMMCELLVEGGERLYGELTIQGSKNRVLPILAATLLCADTCVIENCPKLRDVDASVAILRHLGCCTHWEDSALVVDTARMDRAVVPDALMREMRSSVIFLGAILARCKEATICYPGGCELGPRPIDLHLSALSALGAEIRETGGELKCRGGTLLGSDVYLPMPSVGATENALLCACGADGVTTIYNAACEPYVQQLCRMLNRMGAKIEGIASNLLTIEGVDELHGTEHTILPDMIEVGSFIGMAAMTRSELTIKNVSYENLGIIPDSFRRLGIKMEQWEDDIYVPAQETYQIESFIDGSIMTIADAPWPGLTPDLLSVLLVVATQAKGSVLIHQKMFESRLFFVDKLIDMGAQIILCDPHRAVVIGHDHGFKLRGGNMTSPDIRAGIALLIAAMSADGISRIHNIEQIDRGYQNIEGRLNALGARITRIE